MRNGCCKACMKAFNKVGPNGTPLSQQQRSCLCQVPSKVRKGVLGKEGCKFCGCHGCHPSDMPVMNKHYGKQ